MMLKEASAGFASAEGDAIVGYVVLEMVMLGRDGVMG